MAKGIKLSDENYTELDRIKRELEHRRNRNMTLWETVGVVLRVYQAILAAVGGAGDVRDQDNP